MSARTFFMQSTELREFAPTRRYIGGTGEDFSGLADREGFGSSKAARDLLTILVGRRLF